MPFGAALPGRSATKPGPGFDVARQPSSPRPSEAPKNVQNSKSFHVENAIEFGCCQRGCLKTQPFNFPSFLHWN